MAGVLVIAEHFGGNLAAISRELVTIATDLKRQLGGQVSILVLSDGTDDLADQANLMGVDKVIYGNVGSAHFDAMIYEAAIVQVSLRVRPSAILFGHTSNGMACAAGVAARLGLGFASDVIAIEISGDEMVATKTAFGGKVNLELSFPNKEAVALTVRGATFKPCEAAGAAQIVTSEVDLSDIAGRAQHLDYAEAPKADVDISKADIILSIGRGILEPENIPRFANLAKKLDVTLGCSRPFADAGLMPKAHQVGQSGTTASSCKLYIAIGISGAVQHLFGMKHVDTIIAINTDVNAPIFDVATFGSTVDALQLATALEARLGLDETGP
jgi:electron transfer flavoprotein alpha subunit